MPVTFQPQPRTITAITRAVRAQVTTSEDHNYNDGQVIQLYVPVNYGMQINGVQKPITVVDSTNFTIDYDTRQLDAFAVPTTDYGYYQPAQTLPVTGYGANLGQ